MPEPESRSIQRLDWLLIAALIALVLPLRLWLLHNTEVTARDSIGYIRYALHFEQHEIKNVLTWNHQHPGYPLCILAISWPIRAIDGATTPENMELSAQLVSLIASTLLLLPMYFLGRQFFDRPVSFTASLLFQYLPISAQHLSDGISEPLFLLFLVSGLLQCVHAVRDRTIGRSVLAGLFTGLAYLTRPEGLLILPAFGLVLIAMQCRREWRCSWPRFVACGVACLISTSLVGAAYVVIVGHITNKPSAKETMKVAVSPLSPVLGGEGLGVRGSVSHACDIRSCKGILNPLTPNPSPPEYRGRGERGSLLFASTFTPSDHRAMQLQRSVRAVALEICQGLHYAGIVPVLLGLWWSLAALHRHPGFWVLAGFACIHVAILVRLAMSVSYVSDRHVMILVILSSYFVIVGVRETMNRILARWQQEPNPRIVYSPAFWTILLLIAFFAACLPKATQRLHGNRTGNHEAGLWLQKQIERGDVIVDDHNWSHFFAGMLFQEGRDTPLPADLKPTCYVVTTRSRDPFIDAKRQTEKIAADARVVYVWPEASEVAKARVIVYAQERDPKTHPWKIAQ